LGVAESRDKRQPCNQPKASLGLGFKILKKKIYISNQQLQKSLSSTIYTKSDEITLINKFDFFGQLAVG
jgi:hypothetical protein